MEMMFTNPFFPERDAWAEQIAENSARTAFMYGTATTKGYGSIRIEEPVVFDCAFVEQPMVMHGFSIDDVDAGDEPEYKAMLPRVSGGVSRWTYDDNDHYVGAHVFCTVDLDPQLYVEVNDQEDVPQYEIVHSFAFSGLALKIA